MRLATSKKSLRPTGGIVKAGHEVETPSSHDEPRRNGGKVLEHLVVVHPRAVTLSAASSHRRLAASADSSTRLRGSPIGQEATPHYDPYTREH